VNVLLLDPPHAIFGGLRMWMPSPGLMALAASLERHGFSVDIIDATTLAKPWTDLTDRLGPAGYDVVGVTCQAATFHHDAVQAVRLVRLCLPQCVIVGGGGHFSLNATEVLQQVPELDCLVVGEGELTFAEVIQAAAEGRQAFNPEGIPGLAFFNQDGQVEWTAPRPQIEDLDSLPQPAYHKVDLEDPTYQLHGMGRRAVGISTSRGCGDRCSYCSESVLWRSKWRGRSGPAVVEEMQELNRRYGKTLFVFNENSFNQSRQRNESFLQSLGSSGLRSDFWFQSRVSDILRDRDLLPEFRRLGLYEVMLGVESITPETLRNYSKNQTFEEITEAARLLREQGIMVMTNVMFGDWFDTEETLREIVDYCCRIGDFLVLTLTTPLPGTRYYQKALASGLIEEEDYGRFDFMHPIMPNARHTREEILALHRRYLKKYYTRPSVFWRMFFSRNRFVRMSYRLIMRHAWYEARGKVWVQPNFEPVPDRLTRPVETAVRPAARTAANAM
jgi:anaerobic magnesium-protoporphyrin IX monomethyl ester cyclase